MLGTILVVFLILALLGALPRWSHSRGAMPRRGALVLLSSLSSFLCFLGVFRIFAKACGGPLSSFQADRCLVGGQQWMSLNDV